MMDRVALRRLIAAPPNLHGRAAAGAPVRWGIQGSFLRFLAATVSAHSLTLETGSGVSTICFALLGAEHICVSPAPEEHERILAYCREHGIATDRVRFMAMESQAYLPTMERAGRKLDFALIDGAHTFPDAIRRLLLHPSPPEGRRAPSRRRFGYPVCGYSAPVPGDGPHIRRRRIRQGKTGIYRKVRDSSHAGDWFDQRFNRGYPDFRYLPVPSRIPHAVRKRLGRVPFLRRIYDAMAARARPRSGGGSG